MWIVSAGALAVVVKFVFCNGKIRPFTEVYNGKMGVSYLQDNLLAHKKEFRDALLFEIEHGSSVGSGIFP